MLIQIPTIQTRLVSYVTDYLSEALNFPIEIKKVEIHFLHTLRLSGIELKDNHQKHMIGVKTLDAVFSWRNLLDGKKIIIDEVRLDSAGVYLYLDESSGELNMDEFVRRIRRLSGPSTDTTPSKPFPFIIERIKLTNTQFSYMDMEEKEYRKGFDHFHFGFKDIKIIADSFKINRDTVQMYIRHLSAIETSSGTPVHSITGFYRMTNEIMETTHLKALIGKSRIENHFAFRFKEIYHLSSFLDSVDLELDLEKTSLHTSDLAIFASELAPIKQIWTLSGHYEGKVGDFNARKATIGFGKYSKIQGNFDIQGLPDFYNTFADIELKNSIVYPEDLKPYLDENTFSIFKKFGKTKANGTFIGFPLDFVYQGDFETALGYINADVNLKLKGMEESVYQGRVITKDLDIGPLVLMDPWIKTLDMKGKIEGKGLRLSTLKLFAEADISNIQILGHNYTNIQVNASLAKNFFNGKLHSNDTSFTLQMEGYADLNTKPEQVNLQFNLQKANFQSLGWSSLPLKLSGRGDLDFLGLIRSETQGDLHFDDIKLTNGSKSANVRDLDIQSQIINGKRNISIQSDVLDAQIQGNFLINTVIKELNGLTKDMALALWYDSTSSLSYYQNKPISAKQDFDLQVKIGKINPLLSLFYTDVQIAPETQINGTFESGDLYACQFKIVSPSMVWKEHHLNYDTLAFDLTKPSNNKSIIAHAHIGIGNDYISKKLELFSNRLDVTWKGDSAFYEGFSFQKETNNNIHFKGNLFSKEAQTFFHLDQAQVQVLGKSWEVQRDNLLTWIPNAFIFKDFNFLQENQKIKVYGTLNNNPLDPLNIWIENFDLQNLNGLLKYNLNGKLQAKMAIKDLFDNLSLESNINLDSLVVDQLYIGTVKADALWDNFLKKILLSADLYREGKNIVSVAGHYDPKDGNQPLNLDAEFTDAQIKVIEPFINYVVSDLEGVANGVLDINGSFAKPSVMGMLQIKQGKMKVNYLNTYYSFDDYFYFNKDFMGFVNCEIRDDNNHIGHINGGILHNYFSDMSIRINGDFNNFNLLNTTEKDNDVFYGQGIASGTYSIIGPFDDLLFKSNIRSEEGTKLYLPLTSGESVKRQDFIQFVIKKNVKKDTAIKEQESNRIKVDLTLELTNDAYCEIIFDKKSGDVIRGNGHGVLNLDLDTKGDFHMFGEYTIDQGAYNFTMLNIINKGFTIKSGSKVKWIGDPWNAQLDITATYAQNVQLTPIMPLDTTMLKSNPAFTRRYPTQINLNLKGNMLKPDISYGIEIKDYPTNIDSYPVDLYVKAFLANVQSNEQEMNKQVFSLLVLRSFLSNTDSRLSNLSQSAFGSVSELVSNQLNNWLSQVDENLTIDIDLNGLDRNALNAMRMRLSYSLMQGRLRITRDGGFTNTRNQASTYSVLGEWTVEYLLTKDGILRLKMFNKNNPNAGVTALDANSTGFQGGFSLLHTQSFDNLEDLFKKKEKEEEQKRKRSLINKEGKKED